MLRQVHLYGSLESLTKSRVIELEVDSPIDLINALRSQVSGFRAWSADNKLGIVLMTGGEAFPMTKDDFVLGFGSAEEVHLVPETAGAGTGVGEMAAAAAFEFAAAYGVQYYTVAYIVAYVAITIAVSYVTSAISQALAPSVDTSGGSGRAEERPSFLYAGAVNVVEQGYAVPLVYGTHMTGSIVVSAGVSVEDIPYVPADPEPVGQPEAPPVEDWQWDTSGGGY